MKTPFGKVLAAISVAGLLASAAFSANAAQPADTPEMRTAAQNAVTSADHLAVAKSYEDMARQLQAKAQEQQALLEQYQNKSYMYGRQAQDLQSLVFENEKYPWDRIGLNVGLNGQKCAHPSIPYFLALVIFSGGSAAVTCRLVTT